MYFGYRARPHDLFVGTPGDDTLQGTDKADTLDGGAGADLMIGGKGRDTYYVDNIGDVVVEETTDYWAPHDLVIASIDYTLHDHVEDLLLTGDADLSGTGNEEYNEITGNDGANVLNGLGSGDTLWGGLGNDSLYGGDGSDDLHGGDGDDLIEVSAKDFWSGGSLFGDAGNDTLRAWGEGLSVLMGGDGDDLLLVKGDVWGSRLYGDDGHDVVKGGSGDESMLDGGAGQDTVRGRGGNDLLGDGDDDADQLDGGAGEDTLQADYSSHLTALIWTNDPHGTQTAGGNTYTSLEVLSLRLGAGNDVIDNSAAGGGNALPGEGGDVIRGGAGDDQLTAGGYNGNLYGDDGNDTLVGGAGATDLYGGSGRDYLLGSDGWDYLYGDDGRDTLDGGAGSDRLYDYDTVGDTLNGGSGDDVLIGYWAQVSVAIRLQNDPTQASLASGNTLLSIESLELTLGAGNDVVANLSATGRTELTGNGGNDHLSATHSVATLEGGVGNDTLIGGSKWDTLIGGAGDDSMFGGGENDSFQIGVPRGADTVDGGEGLDHLDLNLSAATTPVVWVNDGTTPVTLGGVQIVGIESFDLDTGSGDDIVDNSAQAGRDTIKTGDGDDVVASGGGDDTVDVGNGNDAVRSGGSTYYDSIRLGAGEDALIVDSLDGYDVVLDFKEADDRLVIDQTGLVVGDGDTTWDDAEVIASPGGYSASAELVISTQRWQGLGSITDAWVADGIIGSADQAFKKGHTAIFVVEGQGGGSAVYFFESSGKDADVSSDELTLIAHLKTAPNTTIDDYLLMG